MPRPPSKVSAPTPPSIESWPAPPVMTLASALPVPCKDTPVKTRFSTLAARVRKIEDRIVSLPSPTPSVTTSELLSTT
ncbi:MAG: hypothetical protein C4K60_05690 [Ideonella sp. MAG2]|nr:MAG: hypothetical protein C4K60_05690 [Ideonella sp. MAG2]